MYAVVYQKKIEDGIYFCNSVFNKNTFTFCINIAEVSIIMAMLIILMIHI